MRQIGTPPEIDKRMREIQEEEFTKRGIKSLDAAASTGSKDFLERIVGLIRATGFTVAIFSNKTRPTAVANIMLELGFAAMSGKPLIILKSKRARAPSDFTRTDWINYDELEEDEFRTKINQALDTVESTGEFEHRLLQIALQAKSIDCGIATERAIKAFLLTGDSEIIDKADLILERLQSAGTNDTVDDLERLQKELQMFVGLSRASLAGGPAAPAAAAPGPV